MGQRMASRASEQPQLMDRQCSTGPPTEGLCDPVSSLPFELVAEILFNLSTADLKVCRLVSRSWQSFIDNPEFWQFAMRKRGNFSSKLMDLPPGSINWAQLYHYQTTKPNLINNFDSDNKLSLEPWTVFYLHWPDIANRLDDPNIDDYGFEDRWDGGNKWAIETGGWIKPTDPNYEQLLHENNGSDHNYVTSFGWCCRKQIIKLSDFGLSDAIMDNIRPTITASEWFAARWGSGWGCGLVFNIQVELLGVDNKILDKYEHSVKMDQWHGEEKGWRRVEHGFKNYPPGVRRVRFADAGKDTLWWRGHYGSKMAAARLVVKLD